MKFEDYRIPGIDLRKHQIETIQFIMNYRRCFVLDDIGTGKTMAALAAMDFLMINEKIRKVLVICPLSVLYSTWVEHIMGFFPHRKFGVLHGSKAQRINVLKGDYDFYLMNTDGVKIIETEVIKKKFDVVIVDESTSYSTHNTMRTKSMWRIAKDPKGVVCMTGNPIPNDTLQSFSQARIVNPTTAPRYFTKYRDELKIKLDMFTYVDRPEAVSIAHSVLQPAIRHRMEDCIDLPPITYEVRDIQLTDDQSRHYEMMKKEYLTLINENVITASNAAVKAMKLMQISAGLIIDEEGNYIGIDHKYRTKELLNIYGQMERKKIIVFATFTKSIDGIASIFTDSNTEVDVIDGSVPARRRQGIIQEFQKGSLNVLVCQPAAISHGVTLHTSDTIVWWSPVLSNEQYVQCNGRIRRSGQTRPQLVVKFQSTDIEKRIYKALEAKQSVSRSLLDMV